MMSMKEQCVMECYYRCAYPVFVCVAGGVTLVSIEVGVVEQLSEHLCVAFYGGQVSWGVAINVDNVGTDEAQQEGCHMRLVVLGSHVQ